MTNEDGDGLAMEWLINQKRSEEFHIRVHNFTMYHNRIRTSFVGYELLLDSYYHTEGTQEGEEVLCKFYKLKNELK